LPNGSKDAPEDYREADHLEWDFFSRIKVIWIIQSPLKNQLPFFRNMCFSLVSPRCKGASCRENANVCIGVIRGDAIGAAQAAGPMTGSASKLRRARASLFAPSVFGHCAAAHRDFHRSSVADFPAPSAGQR